MTTAKNVTLPELTLTVCHRTFSAQCLRCADHFYECSVTMSEQPGGSKRQAQLPVTSDVVPPTKKRSLQKSTVDRWIVENDKALSTATWLKYETNPVNRGRVVTLKCSVCCQFADKLVGMRNYNTVFVEGTSNLRSSSFKDHAASEMHSWGMLYS